jgi:integrase
MKPPITDLVKVEPDASLDIFERRPDLRDDVADYARASESKNTAKARRFDWAVFTEWCGDHVVQPLPASPATVAAFLADQSKHAGKAVATVHRYARSIGAIHALRGCEMPTKHEAVKRVLAGIRRERGVKQKQLEAFDAAVASVVLPGYAPANELAQLRDRAIVLIGLHTAMRASEICSLDLDDLRRAADGYIIMLRKSKTDQEGVGAPLALFALDDQPEFCPVRAVDAWLRAIDLQDGPLFCGFKRNGAPRFARMTPGTVNVIVRRVIEASGQSAEGYGAHSLRAGYVTTARKSGVEWAAIMEQTRHKRLETAKLYTRYTPDVFKATKIADVFAGAFKKNREK